MSRNRRGCLHFEKSAGNMEIEKDDRDDSNSIEQIDDSGRIIPEEGHGDAIRNVDETWIPPDGGYGWVCVVTCWFINAHTVSEDLHRINPRAFLLPYSKCIQRLLFKKIRGIFSVMFSLISFIFSYQHYPLYHKLE
jgi:hypothetical protein